MSALLPRRTIGVYTLAAPLCYASEMAGSASSPQDRSPYEDRRAYPRVPVAMPAFLQAHGERHSVQLLDLSPAGAKLDCPASLPVGTAVILDCGTLARGAVSGGKAAGSWGFASTASSTSERRPR